MGNQEKRIKDIIPDTASAMDFSDTVMHVCVCGSRLWTIKVMFEDHDISMIFTDMECALCGTKAKAPTPDTHPDYPMNV